MTLSRSARQGAATGAGVAVLAAVGEVVGTAAGFIPAYQREVGIGVFAYAMPIYGAVGAVGGAILGALLWRIGVREAMPKALMAIQGAGWFVALGGILLNQFLRYDARPTVLALLNGGLALGGLGVGALLWLLGGTRGGRLCLGIVAVVFALALGVPLAGKALSSDQDGRPPTGDPTAQPLPNIVLMVLDTVRADHLSASGYSRLTSPTVDRLAAEGTRFAAAMAPSSWTLPSIGSLMTGVLPSTHGADHGHWFLNDENLTLAEILRARGYATAGFVGGPFARATFGLGQGFNTYDDVLTPPIMNVALVRATAKVLRLDAVERKDRSADRLNVRILPWLERNAGRPFFLFINYFDAHAPYQPPGGHARRWASADGVNGGSDFMRIVPRVLTGQGALTPAERDQLVGLYDGEIAFLDTEIERLVGAMSRLGVLDRTVLVITADHGESFGEHDLMDHGNALYEDQVHVPLVIRFPARVPAGRVVSTPVTTLDVFSTLLDLVAVPVPPAIQSQSLLPLLGGGASADDRTLVAELRRSENWSTLSPVFARELLALRRGPWKYIASSTGSTELYHIPEDPEERDNRVQREPEVARSFQREALRWMRRAGSGQQRSIDQATREQLKSLGY